MRARRASGGREGDLVQRASRLRKAVDPLLPRLTDTCPPEPFDRLRTALERVREHRDDERRLERVGRFEDPIVRAYAGLLRFYLEPELPGVLVARFPAGEVSFAPLGKAPREAQIAVQQFDDPRRLLLGYLGWARKGFHFFASDEELVCTGRSSRPPETFLRAQRAALPYRLVEADGGRRFDCAHLAAGEPRPRVRVEWPGAETSFAVCLKCAKGDRQLLASLSSGLAVPKPEKALPFDADLNVACEGGEGCVHRRLPGLSRRLRKQYLFGRVSDGELLDQYRKEIRPLLDGVRTPTFVAAGRCYGSDRARFLDRLEPTPEERQALEGTLAEVPGLFEVEEATASQALERLWPTHAEEIVRAIVPDAERAARLAREARAAPGRVSDLLQRAARETREQAVLDSLPRYRGLVPEARYADAVARAFRTGGGPAAGKAVLQGLPREGKERGIGFAFLSALELAGAHRWQFSETEQQFGAALAGHARALLDAPAGGYDEKLGALLAAAGVTAWGTRETP